MNVGGIGSGMAGGAGFSHVAGPPPGAAPGFTPGDPAGAAPGWQAQSPGIAPGLTPGAAPGTTPGVSPGVTPGETPAHGAALPGRIGALSQVLQGYSSAEILLAMTLLGALDNREDEKGGSGAALGLLIGLSIGRQLATPAALQTLGPASVGGGAGLGGQLNLMA